MKSQEQRVVERVREAVEGEQHVVVLQTDNTDTSVYGPYDSYEEASQAVRDIGQKMMNSRDVDYYESHVVNMYPVKLRREFRP